MNLTDEHEQILAQITEAREREQATIKQFEAALRAQLKALKEGEGYKETHALMREQKNVTTATGDHERIMAALKAGDLDKACAALKRNMQSGREPIVKWLKARAAQKGSQS